LTTDNGVAKPALIMQSKQFSTFVRTLPLFNRFFLSGIKIPPAYLIVDFMGTPLSLKQPGAHIA
jgi:hypothetical protein